MKTRKKRLLMIALTAMLMGACSAHTGKSFTFQVETGDRIKIELDTSGGDYDLSQEDGHFAVEKGKDTVLNGVFLTEKRYEEFTEVKNATNVNMLEERVDGNSYMFYEVDGEAGIEHDFLIWVKDSHTGVLLGSLAGKEEAKAAFERLEFSVDKE